MDQVQRIEGEFIHGGVVSGHNVRLNDGAARVTVGRPGPKPAEPQVEVIREGDVIKAIDVICSCGQRVRLRCVY